MRRLAALLALVALAACTAPGTEKSPANEGPPNVLIIMTDDQRATGTLGVMRATRELFQEQGTTFRNAVATTPLCCPSRASVMSGRYAHNHGVLKNTHPHELDEDTTLQRYLADAGYQTGYVGKFFNSWNLEIDPRHFDRWAITRGGDTRDYNVDGEVEIIDDYSTFYIRDTALEYLEQFERNDDQPWLMYVGTVAVHRPFEAAPGDEDAPLPPWDPNPAIFEKDRSDKPRIPGRATTPALGRALRAKQLRSLLAVDRMVERIFSQLERDGEEDTIAVFMSDNGHSWGEHRLEGKRFPYNESIELPLLLRWPGEIEPGVVDDRIVANVDVAPTLMEATGVEPDDGVERDGRSLLGEASRKFILLEQWGNYGKDIPDWASLRDEERQYVEYYGKKGKLIFREYYDLAADPWQLENLLGNGNTADDPDVSALRRRLIKARDCTGRACP